MDLRVFHMQISLSCNRHYFWAHVKQHESITPNERRKAFSRFLLIPMADERDFIGQKIRASIVSSPGDFSNSRPLGHGLRAFFQTLV